MIKSFIQIADIALDQGGEASFEWPRYCRGLNNSVLLDWIIRRQLRSNGFPGCAVGVTAKGGLPARKPWRIMTSSKRLASDLLSLKCSHSEHAPLEGQWTQKPAFYPKPSCVMMLQSLLPCAINQYVFSMPCVPKRCQPHRHKLAVGYLSVPLNVIMAETGCNKITTPALFNKLLDCAEWKGHPEALKSIKNEKPSSEWIVKADILFRGDAVRDEENQTAIFDEIAASAPTNLSGLYLIMAYGLWMAIWLQPATASKLTLNVSWVCHNLLVYFCPLSWFQIMLSISISLALHLWFRYTAILWPVRLGRTISSKSLPISWMDLNLRSSHHAYIFQTCD